MKKINIIVLMLSLILVLSSCRRFEKKVEKIPSGYSSYASIEEYISGAEDPISLENLCVGKYVYVLSPGLKEYGTLSSAIDNPNIKIDSIDYRYTADDVLNEYNASHKDIVILYAPGVSAKGLGDAGIKVNEEIERFESILELKTTLATNSNKMYVIEVNTEAYGSNDGKSETVFNTFFNRIDLMIVTKERNCNIFRQASIDYSIPVLEISIDNLQDVLLTILGI